jgi:hypothetical protein
MLLGDFFDVHAAFGAGHDNGPGGGAIQQYGAIKFLFDGGRAGDQKFADQAPFRAGLLCHQHVPQHGFGLFKNILRRPAELDAALKAALESALAAPARVDLSLDDHHRFAFGEKPFRDGFGRFGRVANFTRRHGHTVLREQLFGLEFVYIHLLLSSKFKVQSSKFKVWSQARILSNRPLELAYRSSIGLTFSPTGPM